jgi:CRISPR-associated protein Csm2
MEIITETNYVDHAERVIESMIIKDKTGRGRDKINLTTSKIRNLLSMVNNLQALIKQEKEPEISGELMSKVQYLKMRFAYEAGREQSVKDFVKKASIMEIIEGIGKSKKKLLLFCNYMEALVAYHRYKGGKDR